MLRHKRYSPVFSVIIDKKDISPHFRCKVKFCSYAQGTVISAEIVNSPKDFIVLHTENESICVKTYNGYGYSAVYSPLPPCCFEKCNICVE